jgi:hypothetical protein
MVRGQLADPGDLVAGDPDPCAQLGAPQPAGYLELPRRVDHGALGELPIGPQVVQLQRNSLVNRVLALTSCLRCTTSSRISSSGSDSRAVGGVSSPSRSAARATRARRLGLTYRAHGRSSERQASTAAPAAPPPRHDRARTAQTARTRADNPRRPIPARCPPAPWSTSKAPRTLPTRPAPSAMRAHTQPHRLRDRRMRPCVRIHSDRHDLKPSVHSKHLKRTAGGQFSVGARPRSYQVTPAGPLTATGDKSAVGQRQRLNRDGSARSRQGPSNTPHQMQRATEASH